METCTFFGHRDTPKEIEPLLHSTLIDLIENHNVHCFLVGNEGNFDRLVRKELKLMKIDYPHIMFSVVLAYMPGEKDNYCTEDWDETICPYLFDKLSPRYAIPKRNRWLINNSDYVVTYVKRTIGGAAQYKELAEKKGKTVINLADLQQE